jgi:hypothetical protein
MECNLDNLHGQYDQQFKIEFCKHTKGKRLVSGDTACMEVDQTLLLGRDLTESLTNTYELIIPDTTPSFYSRHLRMYYDVVFKNKFMS